MKLTDREWKPILIASYFSFVRGSENNMALLEVGDIRNRQILRDCTYHKIRGKISLSSAKEQVRIIK